ncbi:unnamed protein product [Clonostachys rosea]|uniref:MYND-type domain-containing protein n=1 Tax=Bionectria ochroleuca TaxID=29856 RepID=A0ABY6U3G3_BIOOC|nr:unnamed protein product [Clonostachys rosea]
MLIQTNFKGPKGPLVHRCQHCKATAEHLPRCSACKAVRYCNDEHQRAHRGKHKSACNQIKKARAKLSAEEERFRNDKPTFDVVNNYSAHSVSDFWGMLSTRYYMRARYDLVVGYLLPVATLDSSSEALEHMVDMIKQSREESLDIPGMIPATMLRLGLDQECHDFIKSCCKGSSDPHAPSASVTHSDVFEPPEDHLKLAVDVINVIKARKALAGTPLPSEIRGKIEMEVVRSPLSAHLYRESSEYLSRRATTCVEQIRHLGIHVMELNKHFNHLLFTPDLALSTPPSSSYSLGSWGEAAATLQNSYAAWWEAEGVLELLADARVYALRDTEPQLEEMRESERISRARGIHDGPISTDDEMLAHMSVIRVWTYMDWAVEDSWYLGPVSERPSGRQPRFQLQDSEPEPLKPVQGEEGCYPRFNMAEIQAVLGDERLSDEDRRRIYGAMMNSHPPGTN